MATHQRNIFGRSVVPGGTTYSVDTFVDGMSSVCRLHTTSCQKFVKVRIRCIEGHQGVARPLQYIRTTERCYLYLVFYTIHTYNISDNGGTAISTSYYDVLFDVKEIWFLEMVR